MVDELKKVCKVELDVDLTKYNTYRLNSVAYAMVYPTTISELTSILKIINNYETKYFVIGNGSNIILPDYYDGVIIKPKFNKCIISKDYVYVESSYMLNKLALYLSNKGYTGYEWACGIPGTIGGSIYGNAGAYNSSIKDVLLSAMVYDGKNIIELSNEELKFDYRYSILKEKNNYIVLSCKLKLVNGNIKDILSLIEERTNKRITSQDLSHPSAGSVFRNPNGLSAGKLIDDLSLKGYKINGAKISEKHANFIINDGFSISQDIIKLIKYIKKEVKSSYNIDLVLEQEIIK